VVEEGLLVVGLFKCVVCGGRRMVWIMGGCYIWWQAAEGFFRVEVEVKVEDQRRLVFK
jgi:heme/copper-type cytochrome/quinol oxidase subunit 1